MRRPTARVAPVLVPSLKPVTLPPDAKGLDIVRKMADTYVRAGFYRDKGEVRTTFYDKVSFVTRKPFSLSFVRGANLFRFQYAGDATLMGSSSYYVVWSNGLEVRSWWTLRPKVTLHKDLGSPLAAATGVSGGSSTDIPHLLLPTKIIPANYLKRFAPVRSPVAEKIGTTDCWRLENADGERLWVEQRTFLVRKLRALLYDKNTKSLFDETITTFEPSLAPFLDFRVFEQGVPKP